MWQTQVDTLSGNESLTAYLREQNTPRELVADQAVSTGYQSWNWASFYNNQQKRPPFRLVMADLMLLDPRVLFGLAIGNAPLLSAEVEVTGPRPDVVKFVQEQWERLWSTSAQFLLRDKDYGHMAYEVMYCEHEGRVEIDALRDFHPRDVRPLTISGQLRGIRVVNLQRDPNQARHPGGTAILRGMKGLWLTYDGRFNNRFGRSLLQGAYAPWYEKSMDGGGALDLRRLRMVKDAWIGDVLRVPLQEVIKLADGSEITAPQLAQEVQTLRMSGGALILPSEKDDQGNFKWEYTPPTSVQGVTSILEWTDKLDFEIFDGLLVPREVVEAAETGSGFSGRSIPFIAFLAIRDVEHGARVRQIKAQLLDKLVCLNFGLSAVEGYEIKPKPLLETVGKQMGDMGQPNTRTPGATPGPSSLPWAQQQRPSREEEADGDLQFATVDEPRAQTRDRALVRRSSLVGASIAAEVRGRLDTLLKKND